MTLPKRHKKKPPLGTALIYIFKSFSLLFALVVLDM